MELKLLKNIWKTDESYLGFYCTNIFQSSVIYPNLKELLNNNILKEEEFCDVSHSRKEKKRK
ncbi:hypothetical protein C3L50_09455 [Flavobacterium alvei]|uniref:Uncharacterized protein n=1 Tax=Flavobacterium alvei TaxID=2080416 RepID=A0A2S5ABX4_9FLAO|nr:hypothetical protein C3L50_09455 [Flavobacterium alvei]